MSKCPTCGFGLHKPIEHEPAICPRCSMLGMMDPQAAPGSSNSADYEIKQEIGRGGDGAVYLCWDRKVRRHVAIKLIDSIRGSDKMVKRRFQMEADAIASLDHPNIIPIYANGEMDGRPFYTMKYVRGGNLATRREEYRAPKKAIALMLKIARAVHHAHERGILHRDLKPSNILLNEQGEPYISDFGLAKRPGENLDLTLAGIVMGTPAYMSPEQASGNNSATTTTSDIFSLGSILFELLTGRLAFEGTTSHNIIRNVIENDIWFSAKENNSIDRDLETVVLKCLRKDPEKRYATAQLLATDLERWQHGFPVNARRISKTERTIRWMLRHPIPIAGVTFSVISLIIGTIVSLSLWRHAEIARKHSDRDRDLAQEEKTAANAAREEADRSLQIAEQNHYFAIVANALAAREQSELGEAQRLLNTIRPDMRGFEWRLVAGLSRSDALWTSTLGKLKPLYLVRDRHRVMLLTSDRAIHEVDPTTGNISLIAKLPDTPKMKSVNTNLLGLHQYTYSPDGNHYCFVDGEQLVIANSKTSEIVHNDHCGIKASIGWINSSEIIQFQNFHHELKEINRSKSYNWKYNLSTKEKIIIPNRNLSGPIALTSNRKLAAVVKDKTTVEIHQANGDFNKEPIYTFYKKYGWVRNIKFSSDDKFVVISWVGFNTHVELWNLEEKKLIFDQMWPSQAIVELISDELLLMMGRESWFTSWNLKIPRRISVDEEETQTGIELTSIYGPFRPPSSLIARSDSIGRRNYLFGHHAPAIAALGLEHEPGFITASLDGTICRWPADQIGNLPNLNKKALTSHIIYHPNASHNGDFCLYRNRNQRYETWLRSNNSTKNLPENNVGLAILNDGRAFSYNTLSKDIICWKTTGDGPVQELWRCNAGQPTTYSRSGGIIPIHSSVTPDERFLAVLYPGHLLTLDIEEKKGVTSTDQTMFLGVSPGQTIAISPDGKFTAVTGFKGATARVYLTADPTAPHRLVDPKTPYISQDSACVFSRDGNQLYVGNNDGWIRVYAMPSLEELTSESWQAHSSEVTALAISQNGDVIASAGGQATILWSAEKHALSRQRLLNLHTGDIARNWLQFCNNDNLFFHSGHLRPIEVWEALPEPIKAIK